MKSIIPISLLVFIVSCSNHDLENIKFDDIDKYSELPVPCKSDKSCKLIDRKYVSCGGRDVILYSDLTIQGESEKHLINLSEKIISRQKSSLTELQECTLVVPKPPIGICWENQCEIIYRHRQ